MNLLGAVNEVLAQAVRTKDDLRDYQREKLIPFLLENPRSAAYVDMGLGKAQPVSANVLTPNGWKKIGKLSVGDWVIGANGERTRVVGVFPQGRKQVFRVVFNDGAETRCCDEHLWRVNTPLRRSRGLPSRVLSLSEIRASLVDGQGNRRHFIPVVDAVEFTESDLPVDPYLLGVLLGDGGIKNTVTLASVDKEILDAVASVLPDGVLVRSAGGCNYRLSVENGSGSNPLTNDLRELGVMGLGSDDKFIPANYRYSPVKHRIALLQGLMDTDGYASKDGVVQFSSNSERLVDHTRELVCSLGGVARKTWKISASGKWHYLLTISLPYWMKPFRLRRKLSRYSPREKYLPTRAFAKVEPDGVEAAVCIEVAAGDHLYVTDDYIVTHNTVSVLTALDILYWRGEVNKVLIIAPLRVAVQTWPTEIADWRHTAWMPYRLIRSNGRTAEISAKERGEAALSDAPIHLINREQVKWLVEFWLKRNRWPYDTIIIDESTSFSDHRTARWKALAKVAQRTKRIHLLSGTPAPEGIQDLFAQIYLLDGGVRFGKGITNFQKRYMMQNPYTRKWTPQTGAVEQVTKLCADICLVMKEADHLDTKLPLVFERPVVLDPEVLQRYREFERELVLQLPDDVEIEAVNAGVLSMKLLQYASGAIYDENRKVHPIHEHKIEEMRELRAEVNSPLLVAYWFRPSLDRLRKAFPKAVVMDKEGKCVKDWNAGKVDMLLVHPQSAGHGLNMQYGPGHTLVFYDTPASLELYLQTIKRIARPGQKALVKVIHLVARGTLDTLAVPRLRGKESAQDAVTDYLRKLRQKLILHRRAA